MNQPELKPCPFCGNPIVNLERVREEDHVGSIFAVECGVCYARGPLAGEGNWFEAIDKWNIRRKKL